MRSRLLRLRLWLEKNGLFPRGRLAVITCYLLAFDVLLFCVQKIAALFHRHFGEYLGAWVTLLSLIAIVLLFVLAVRRISAQLLWRMRNRLIVSYVFIGVVPLLLLVSLAGLALYLFAGQFSTYIVTSRLDSELQQLRAGNAVVAAEISGGLNASQSPQTLESMVKAANDTRITVWLDGKILFFQPANSPSLSLPRQLQPDLTAVVRDEIGRAH